MKTVTASMVLLLWMVGSMAALAQKDTASKLEVLATEYEAGMAELALPLAEWKNRYRAELKKLEPAVRAKGDLEQMLAIRKEVENLDAELMQAIAPAHRELKRLRDVYDKRAAQILKSSDLKAHQLHSAYQVKLKALQTELTKASKIDEALLVREALATLERSGPGLAGTPVAITGNRSPGKLIVGGKYYNGEPVLITPEMKAKSYVRVFSGPAKWYGLTAEGKLELAPGGAGNFKVPEDARPFVDVRCGKGAHYGIHADGTYTAWGENLDPVLASVSKVKHIGAGHLAVAFVRTDGTVAVTGLRFASTPWKLQGPAEVLRDAAFAAANENYVYIIKQDHTPYVADFKTGELLDSIPEALVGKKVVDMRIQSSSPGVLILTDQGAVIPWRAPAPPQDLAKARAIRMGNKVGAAQMMDGSWQVFGRTEEAQNLKSLIEPLGPLKDLAFGNDYFVALK